MNNTTLINSHSNSNSRSKPFKSKWKSNNNDKNKSLVTRQWKSHTSASTSTNSHSNKQVSWAKIVSEPVPLPTKKKLIIPKFKSFKDIPLSFFLQKP